MVVPVVFDPSEYLICHCEVLLPRITLFLWQRLTESFRVPATVLQIQANVEGRLSVDVG